MVDLKKLFPAVASLAGILISLPAPAAPNPAELADHLNKSGVLYYGSWRCPACNAQAKLFGDAKSKLPYVECAKTRELPIQAAACKTAEIDAYPTWIHPNGERRVGVQTLKQLEVWTSMPSNP